MTFSIVACDLEEQAWGVAVASKFPAVGAVVPWAQASAGAVATQSFANTSYGPRGLALMSTGLSADETLARLLQDDPDRELRQTGLVDTQGRSATFTGEGCFPWAGGVNGKGYAIQGNILKSAITGATVGDWSSIADGRYTGGSAAPLGNTQTFATCWTSLPA
jgi:uncharacterized Ntn-hydrolase superfamily protein